MPKKIRELKAMLSKAGFTKRPGKGSHSIWVHEKIPELPITIAGKDGDDAKIYLERQVKQRLKKLEELQ
ncbi:type II toxin-antitoxin system HicA family toxin [Synechocystis salina LEGE 06155]|nr:type II toxin-antitoxin system HicA family toxin [Synechocystis salina LEGE 06155]